MTVDLNDLIAIKEQQSSKKSNFNKKGYNNHSNPINKLKGETFQTKNYQKNRDNNHIKIEDTISLNELKYLNAKRSMPQLHRPSTSVNTNQKWKLRECEYALGDTLKMRNVSRS